MVIRWEIGWVPSGVNKELSFHKEQDDKTALTMMAIPMAGLRTEKALVISLLPRAHARDVIQCCGLFFEVGGVTFNRVGDPPVVGP